MELCTPSAVLRTGAADIVEGCALVPPRQFIRTLGSYFAALVLGRLGGSWEGSGTLLGEAWAPLG